MSTELLYLFPTTILLTIMWIPHVIGQVTSKGTLTADNYRLLRNNSDLPAWGRRADRAHINLVEQFGAFAALVVIAHLLGVANEMTAAAAMTYF